MRNNRALRALPPIDSLSFWQAIRFILVLAAPVMLTNFLQTLVSLVDTLMVGRLGPIAIAAVGMSNLIRALILVLATGAAVGSISLMAQAKGARDPKQQSEVIRQALLSATILGIATGVLGYFGSEPILALMNRGGDPLAVELGTQYLQLLSLGMPFLFLNMMLDRLMQGVGDTRTPLYLTGSLNVVNVIFNYIFMFGFGPIPAMGIRGAALGTVLSRLIAVIIGVWLIYADRNALKLLPGSYRPNMRLQRDIFSIGMPNGVQGIFRNGARMILTNLIVATSAGTLGIAAMSIGVQIESFVGLPIYGIGIAGTSIVGQSLGKWQVPDARRWGSLVIGLSFVLMTLFMIPIIIFAPQIMLAFDPQATPELMEIGVSYLRIATLSLPFLALAITGTAALVGAGDTIPPLMSVIVFRTVIALGLAYLFAFVLGGDIIGIWWSLTVSTTLNGLFILWMWIRRPWSQVALRKSAIWRTHLQHLTADKQSEFLSTVKAPLMAIEGMVENVSESSVVYSDGKQTTEVKFTEGSFLTL